MIGTPTYWAPEVLTAAMTKKYDSRLCDMFSFGCVTFFVFKGEPPFAHQSEYEALNF